MNMKHPHQGLDEEVDLLDAYSRTVVAVSRQAAEAVVQIRPSGSSHPGGQGLGSGFFMEEGGYVLTNAHVLRGAGAWTVTLADGRDLPARRVGEDSVSDLALLQVDAGSPAVLVFGDSAALQVGQPSGIPLYGDRRGHQRTGPQPSFRSGTPD
jgi:serine protease Do